jgi:hypothetical protein
MAVIRLFSTWSMGRSGGCCQAGIDRSLSYGW